MTYWKQLGTGAALLMLGACGSGSASPGASPSPAVMSDAQVLAIGQEYARCVRANGLPDYPDPSVNRGRIEFAQGATVPERAREACSAILSRLPGTAFEKNQQRQVTNEDLATLRRYAQCIREHGSPWFPDPRSDGTFLINDTPLETDGADPPGFTAGMDACKQLEGPGIWLVRVR